MIKILYFLILLTFVSCGKKCVPYEKKKLEHFKMLKASVFSNKKYILDIEKEFKLVKFTKTSNANRLNTTSNLINLAKKIGYNDVVMRATRHGYSVFFYPSKLPVFNESNQCQLVTSELVYFSDIHDVPLDSRNFNYIIIYKNWYARISVMAL